MAAGAEFFLIGASRSEAFLWVVSVAYFWAGFTLWVTWVRDFVPGGGGGWRGGVLRPAVFTDFGLQLAWGRPEGHRGWGGAFTLTGSPVLTASALALGRSRRPGGGGADVVSGTSCSLLPAGPWGVDGSVGRSGGRQAGSSGRSIATAAAPPAPACIVILCARVKGGRFRHARRSVPRRRTTTRGRATLPGGGGLCRARRTCCSRWGRRDARARPVQ